MLRAELLLCIVSSCGEKEQLHGTTRLQKLAYLLEREFKVLAEDGKFNFQPYRFGPLSEELYNDLEFLVTLGLLGSSAIESFRPSPPRADDPMELDASYLLESRPMGHEEVDSEDPEVVNPDIPRSLPLPDSEPADRLTGLKGEEALYWLTDKGKAHLQSIVLSEKERKALEEIRGKYGKMSLAELLRYVYTMYPESAVESEIVNQIL